MGCTASRPAFSDLLPETPLDSQNNHVRGISMAAAPAQNSVLLLDDFSIIPLSPDTYGINMPARELASDQSPLTLSSYGGSPQALAEQDSMEHMLQVLESLDIGDFESNSDQPTRSDQVSSILEDLKPGLERHFNQALGKPLLGSSSPFPGKENAKPVESSPQSEAMDASVIPKGQGSPGATVKYCKSSASTSATVKSPKRKSRFATSFLKRSSKTLGSQKNSHISPKSDTDDESSAHCTLESGEGPNGSLLFDADFLASYETALKELTSEDWNSSEEKEKGMQQDDSLAKGESMQTLRESAKLQQMPRKRIDPLEKFEKLCPAGGEDCVVLYITSLRGIRKTFEDCNSLRGLLESFQVIVDERDIAMHQGFRNELRELMGNAPVPLPRLFIKGRYIGGAEDVLQLHEEEGFAPLLEGLPQDRRGPANPCDGCGGARFVPCLECSGSRKVVDMDNPREVFRCPDCNENGLIQCPICS